MSNTPTLIILAGGASSRMWPLREKSLMCFGAEPLLLSQLRTYESLGFSDVVIVGNPQNESEIRGLMAHLGDRIQVRVAVQAEAKGMGDALLQVAEVLSADTGAVYINQVHDIVDERLHVDMLNMYRSNPDTTYLAGVEMENYFPGGYLIIDETGMISGIMEKPGPDKRPSKYVSMVVHCHSSAARGCTSTGCSTSTPVPRGRAVKPMRRSGWAVAS